MAPRNYFLRDIYSEKREQLAQVEEMLRDLDAILKEAKPVHKKLPSKYVQGLSGESSITDASFNALLTQMGPRNLGMAFGSGRSIADYCSDTLTDLVAEFGSDAEILPYLQLAVLVLGAAVRNVAQEQSTLLSARKKIAEGAEAYVTEFKANASISKALEELVANDLFKAFKDTLAKLVAPLNYSYIEIAERNYYNTASSRTNMQAFLSNAEVKNAATLYLSKNSPSDKVMVPALFGDTSNSVKDAFAKYPDKDLKQTYQYYRDAVKHYMSTEVGLSSADVEGLLKGAAAAADRAKSNISLASISSESKSDIRDMLSDIATDIRRIKMNQNSKEQIVAVATKLADGLYVLENWGGVDEDGKTAAPAFTAGKLTGFDSSNLGKEVLKVVAMVDRRVADYAFSGMSDLVSALYDICPDSTNASVRRSRPGFSEVQDDLAIVFLNLSQAYDNLVFTGITAPTDVDFGSYEVSDEFDTFVVNILNTSLAAIRKRVAAATTTVDAKALNAGVNFAITQLTGIRPGFDIGDSSHEFATSRAAAAAAPTNSANMFVLRRDILRRIAEGSAPSLSGTNILRQLEEKMNELMRRTPFAKRGSSLSLAKRAVSDFDAAMGSAREQALRTSDPIMVRKNPGGEWDHGWKRGVKIGGMSVVGIGADHALTSGIARMVNAEEGSVADYAVDYAPSAALLAGGAVLMHKSEKHKDLAISMMSSAVLTAAARFVGQMNGFRFSDNMAAKIFQYPINGLASVIGDESMAASTVTPADAAKHKGSIAEYVCKLAKTNNQEALCHIAVQLWANGLKLNDNVFSVGDKIDISSKEKAAVVNGDQLSILQEIVGGLCVIKCAAQCGLPFTCEKDTVKHNDKFDKDKKCIELLDKCKPEMIKCVNEIVKGLGVTATIGRYVTVPSTGRYVTVPTTGAFVLEPGYENLNVYSGEDLTTYLQPAPIQTSQPGMEQLEIAIARARKLTPSEKMQEGIADIIDVSVIRASSHIARQIEDSGKGVSLGQSRMNPNTELVALQVEGDNGIWPTAPARQHSVPQGALTYAKIGPAPQVDVSPHGLFNHGVFSPKFGR